MELLTPLSISLVSLAVSLLSLINSWMTRRQSKIASIYALRREALSKARAIEIEWQSALNDIFHFSHRAKKEISDEARRNGVIEYLGELNSTFVEAHKNMQNIRDALETNFNRINANQAMDYLRKLEGMHVSMRSSREEMTKKLELLL